MTTLQEQVRALLEGQNASGYKVRVISRYSHCKKCGKDTGKYSGRAVLTKSLDDCIKAVGELEKELDVFDDVQMGTSADDENMIAIDIEGHAVADGCHKCEVKKEENKMTNLKKMKKDELVAMVEELMKKVEGLEKKSVAPVAEEKKEVEKKVTYYNNQVVDYKGTQILVTRATVNDLDTGKIKFNKRSWTYSWNRGKYKSPIVKGEGFEKKMLPGIKEMLEGVFETSQVYVKKEKKMEEIVEASDDIFVDEMLNA